MILELDDIKQYLNTLAPEISGLADALDIDSLKKELDKLNQQTSDPNFWNDTDKSQIVLKEAKIIKNKIDSFLTLSSLYTDTLDLIEIAKEMGDESDIDDVKESVKAITSSLSAQRLSTLLNGEHDANNAIITFHSGAGGTEAQDWAEMLYRLYSRWAEKQGYTFKILDYQDGEEAGLKSATLLIDGNYAYGYLKGEAGVHRLVRVSPFDSSGRRHTSFASIEVIPEIDSDTSVEIDEKDLRIDTYRSSGAGGQHVNKTDSAVRLTHIPSGIVTSCQNERSQKSNRETAMKMLISKLIEIKEREHLDKIEDIKGEHKDNAWGSQIRSYVFMPYTMVKDHRTNYEDGNIGSVMDGNIGEFISAYLRDKSLGKF